jgi:hypothetical protein
MKSKSGPDSHTSFFKRIKNQLGRDEQSCGEPSLIAWMRQSQTFQPAQVASIEQLKLQNETLARELRRLKALESHHEQDLRHARRQVQQYANTK